jgi:hypothetical protein
MIQVDSLLYKIDQRLNKLSSNEHQQIQLEDKILALNEAQIKLIKTKLSGISVTGGMGMDAFKKRYQDLENLIIPYKLGGLDLTETDSVINQWSGLLTDLPKPYMFYIDSFFLADKSLCKNKVIWPNQDLAKHGDIQFLLNNTHYKPSFEYEESFNVISSDKIHIYTDGTFTPTKLFVSYLRYPDYISKEGFVNFDGTLSINKNCELEAYLEDELLDLTVLNLAEYTENQVAIQTAQGRIQTNE